jgi:D-aspartate ligase
MRPFAAALDTARQAVAGGRRGRGSARPPACVLGDMDLVAPLGRAGIRSAVVAGGGEPARFSRFTRWTIDQLDHWSEQEALAERLLGWAGSQPSPPVLFYQTDGDLLLVSRQRARLAEVFRFVIPDPDLVEDLVDKARFQQLAERLGLPVPRARRLLASDSSEPAMELAFPLVVKPLTRQGLARIERHAKAIRVDSATAMRRLWPRLAAAGVDVLAQELVPGPESGIESYHAYVDGSGAVAGEFTGVKTRTYPPQFGHTTALRITDAADVRDHGRVVVGLLGLRGVLKVDYKRDPSGQLRLLEVNPRFSLWHHPGAAAGVNLPALVYADLTGERRPSVGPARPGVSWCHPWEDRWAADAAGLSAVRWLAWAVRCDTRSAGAWDDPMPFIRGMLWPRAVARLRGSAPGPEAEIGDRTVEA